MQVCVVFFVPHNIKTRKILKFTFIAKTNANRYYTGRELSRFDDAMPILSLFFGPMCRYRTECQNSGHLNIAYAFSICLTHFEVLCFMRIQYERIGIQNLQLLKNPQLTLTYISDLSKTIWTYRNLANTRIQLSFRKNDLLGR